MKAGIEDHVRTMLRGRGLATDVAADEPLFTSGRLDSLAATELMLHLETEHGVDLADPDFDIAQLDTIADLKRLTGEGA